MFTQNFIGYFLAQKLCTKNKFKKKNLNFDRQNVIPIFRSKFYIFVVGQFQIFFSTFSFHFFFPSKTFNFDHFHFRIIKNVSNLDFSNYFFWKKVIFSGGYFLHFFRFLTRFFLCFFWNFLKNIGNKLQVMFSTKNLKFCQKRCFWPNE